MAPSMIHMSGKRAKQNTDGRYSCFVYSQGYLFCKGDALHLERRFNCLRQSVGAHADAKIIRHPTMVAPRPPLRNQNSVGDHQLPHSTKAGPHATLSGFIEILKSAPSQLHASRLGPIAIPRPCTLYRMAIEVTEITSLAGDVETWVQRIVSYQEECDKSGATIQTSDVTYFVACVYPDLWEHAIAPIWKDIKEKLSFQGHGAFAILRTKDLNGGRTGKRNNQHLLPLRSIGTVQGSIWDGEKWLKFEPAKVFRCPDPAYIKGNVEFLVISDREA